jgi:Effector-associated domain 11
MEIKNITIINGDFNMGNSNALKQSNIKMTLLDLVGKAKLDDAFTLFEQWAHNENKSDIKNSLILLKGRFSSSKRNENLGLVSFSNASRNRAILANSFLELVKEIPEMQNIGVQQNFSHNNNQEEMNLQELIRFLKDYNEGILLETKDTKLTIMRWSSYCLRDLTNIFQKGTKDYEECVSAWDSMHHSINSTSPKSDFDCIIENITTYVEMKKEQIVEAEKPTKMELLRLKAVDSTIDTIGDLENYVKYYIESKVGNEKEKLKIDFDEDLKNFLSIGNLFGQKIGYRNLKQRWTK